ncbi:hypothetical protein BDV23DRAFT_189619 [Aspergillus alliaceus]|uniref:Uncharacterized protein n=1 Tax=Petromyces alliaceus TaxID=209559 RepID=A0A5N7BQW2_PETAA|nr:hypothetical protein BDV23DRAFT_189619 [Aspergillus alliaceus]
MKIQTSATRTGEIRDANPNFKILRAMVAIPLPNTDEPVEQGMRRIWTAIEGIVRKSQWTVQHTGQAIQIEAMQSEKGQTLYQLLLAYIDIDSMAKHIQL